MCCHSRAAVLACAVWSSLAIRAFSAPNVEPIPDWVHDALVLAHPAAAVGGCQAGVYTPAVNGIRPWRQAMIRWLTGRHVMGNTAVLVRQEGRAGGAGLSAIVDPRTDYVFQTSVFVPHGGEFGDRQDAGLEVVAAVLAPDNAVIAQAPVAKGTGKWTPCQVEFNSGRVREVRCLVMARSPRRLPCFYYADQLHLARTDRWWSPQNVFDEPRTAVRLPDQRAELCRGLDPDVLAGHNGPYLNWDGFFTRRGVAIGGGFWEQEYNHLSADDPAVGRLLEEGVAREADGRPIAKGALWPGYLMCHNSAVWHSYQQQRLARIAPEVQSIGQDNICAPSFEQAGRGCFCRACREGFRTWIAGRLTPDEIRAAGIADLAAFDVAVYVSTTAQPRIKKGRDAVLADPVLRAYIQLQYTSQLDRWRDTVAAVKRAAGRPLAVGGNQWGAGGQRPYSVALSQVGDFVGVEASGRPYTPQNRAWDALATKLPLAAGEYRRPVWLYLTSLFHASEAAPSRLRSAIAQSWSDGGVPTPWATAPGTSGWFYETEARLCRFVQRHRALFARRQRYANVGLVFSLPTHAWRKFRALGLSPEPYLPWFGLWARLLEESHVPYEANCWFHPLLGSDEVSLARFNRYRVLVLPGVDCFSDAQLKAVRAFQARGGRVISVRCGPPCDANAVPRPGAQTLAAPGDRLIDVEPSWLNRIALAASKPSAQAADDARKAETHLKDVLRNAVAADSILDTDAPAPVWANLWLDDTRQVLALHLVNGDIDLADDRFRPHANVRWRVRLPDGLAIDRAMLVSPDSAEGPGEATPLPLHIERGWATLRVPRLESYAVVALYRGDALTIASQRAEARRVQWRASLKSP